jgi:phosphatidate cytidylyltransferase
MGNDSLFSRSNQESGGLDDAEGVRIIDADTAAEAVERGDAVPRKPDDQPKYGDRPDIPDGPRPTLRFPLAGADAPPVIERPRVAAVEPRSADDDYRPEPPGDVDDFDEPMITLEPATGETELPHWTEPATGEVPRVIIGEGDADIDLAEQERWSSFANSGPRWRDEHDDWDEDAASDLAVGLASEDEDAAPLGALDTSDRLTQEEFLTFDDLNVPTAPTLTGSTPSVGPVDPFEPETEADPEPEPIRIQSTPTPAAAPPTTARSRGRAAPGRAATGPTPPRSGRSASSEPDDGDGGAGRDVPQAVFVGVAIAAVAVILMKIGAAATMVIVEAVIVLSGIELFSAVRRGGHRPATLLGLAAVAAYPLAVYWRGEPAMPLVLFLTVVFTMLWFILGIGGNAKAVPNAGITVLGVAYVGLLGSFAALILKIPVQGVSLLLVTIVAAVFYDVGGFFIGRQFGRSPLTSVSPNKTVEGLAGGMVVAVVATVIVAAFFGPLSFGQSVAFGIALAVAAPLGDLAESLIKRDLGIKDMGTLLPSHGGVLDRFDGMLFVLPTAFYMLRVLGII